MLAQKIALETDERGALASANKFLRLDKLASQPTRLVGTIGVAFKTNDFAHYFDPAHCNVRNPSARSEWARLSFDANCGSPS
jgi:hypothetical protein